MSYNNYDEYSSSSNEDEYDESSENIIEDYEVKRDNDGFVDIYAHGMCLYNGTDDATAAIGVWFDDDNQLNVSSRIRGNQTSNRAEIKAITIACRQALLANVRKIRFHTRSNFVKRYNTDLRRKWKENGWRNRNGETLNVKQELLEMEDALSEFDKVSWNYVFSDESKGIQMARELAKDAAYN
ncbi:ribonuclease H1-like [Leptopilina boulardi]|uniref:ribonuclease H1-like n=1 Tax=Leptopilina boulardi TaxID=63433 RepID=UPI0021F68733|nr:ribonuclease H1-like [Leptopilina boulardi]